MSELGRELTIFWRPHHEVHPELPPGPDFIAFDEATGGCIGRVRVEKHGQHEGRWFWSMTAHSITGRVPFETHGRGNTRGAAGRRVVEAYRRLLEHVERYPRTIPARPADHPCHRGTDA